MKAMLARRSGRRSIGVLVGEREVSACFVGASALGRVEIGRVEEARGSGSLDDQLGRMLGPWLAHRPRPKVVLGVPEVRVFHATRADSPETRKEPEAWLQESLQTAGIRVEDLVIDVAELSGGKNPLAGLVACRRKWLNAPLEALASRSSRLVLVEPSPSALLRAARVRRKPPRGSKLTARFFLGGREALGLLEAGGPPLHWRAFDLPAGEEPRAILSALMALRMQARSWQVGAEVDAVLVHGRPDLDTGLDPVGLAARAGIKVVRVDGPGYDSASIAAGLALGGLAEESGFDLGRRSRARESIGEIFPWGDLVMQSALLLGVILMMSERARSLDDSLAGTRASLARYGWIGTRDVGDLAREKKILEQKDKIAEAFLNSRVLWSSQIFNVARHLPENTRLTSLVGAGELENLSGKGGPGGGKKSFVFRLETPLPESGETPREVESLLGSLRDESTLNREFPLIELRDLKTARSPLKTQGPVASYNIVCLPKAPRAGAPR